MNIRRARPVIVTFDADGPAGLHYLTQQKARLDRVALSVLELLDDWISPDEVFERLGAAAPRDRSAAALIGLIDAGFVVVDGTEAAEVDERFARAWEWGTTAGVFHFGIRNTAYQQPEAAALFLEQRHAVAPSPSLHTTHEASPDRIALPPPSLAHPLLSAMRRRRSRRGFGPAPLPLEALRDCLFASMGIVGFGETPTGRLPLSMTPSGGARNPYEAYVYALNVAGLAPGLYHYAGIDGSLARRRAPDDLPSIPELLGGQAWFAHAGAVILLAASFQRTMWKYPHPGALRVVLIEAGHIAQNMLLAAAWHGLAATPTCALSDALVERLLGLDPVTEGVMHAVVLGTPAEVPSDADFAAVTPNLVFEGWMGE